MKKIYLFTLALVALLAGTSCTKEESFGNNSAADPDVVTFGVKSLASASKTSFEEAEDGSFAIDWESGDIVGISASKDGRSVAMNYPYSATVNPKKGSSATLAPKFSTHQYYYSKISGYTFYAYYPFTGTEGQEVFSLLSCELPSSQVQKAPGTLDHLKDVSLMKSSPREVTDENRSIDLDFYNVYPFVHIALDREDEGSEALSIANITLEGTPEQPFAFSSGMLDLSTSLEQDKTASPLNIYVGEPSVSLAVASPADFVKGTTQNFYMAVAPGSHDAGTVKIKINTLTNQEALVEVPSEVNFDVNTLNIKHIGLSASDFRFCGLGPDDFDANEEYLIVYTDTTGKKYVFPNLAVASKPAARECQTVGITLGGTTDVEGKIRDVYKWRLTPTSGGKFTISYTLPGEETMYLAQPSDASNSNISVVGEEVDGYNYEWTAEALTTGFKLTTNGTRYLHLRDAKADFAGYLNNVGCINFYKIKDKTSFPPNCVTSADNITPGTYVILAQSKTGKVGYTRANTTFVFHHEIKSSAIICKTTEDLGLAGFVDGYFTAPQDESLWWDFNRTTSNVYTITNHKETTSYIWGTTSTGVGVGPTASSGKNTWTFRDRANTTGETGIQMYCTAIEAEASQRPVSAYVNGTPTENWNARPANHASVYTVIVLVKVK